MRISDWSSDVCSSDPAPELRLPLIDPQQIILHRHVEIGRPQQVGTAELAVPAMGEFMRQQVAVQQRLTIAPFLEIARLDLIFRRRSEEHTSELQSLMRISYAVFCLKKKKKKTRTRNYNEPYTCNTDTKQTSNKTKQM